MEKNGKPPGITNMIEMEKHRKSIGAHTVATLGDGKQRVTEF